MGRKSIDYSGKKFGHWDLIEKIDGGVHKYRCVCTKCFEVYIIPISNLLSGRTTQCKECRIEERKNQ